METLDGFTDTLIKIAEAAKIQVDCLNIQEKLISYRNDAPEAGSVLILGSIQFSS